MKTLIVFYSRTGMTRKAAKLIEEKMGWDLEEIVDTKNRSGVIGYLLSGRDALFKKEAKLNETRLNPSDYELVIVGTPVWAGTVSSPIRTYLNKCKGHIKRVAFFCTMGGKSESKTFRVMQQISDLYPEGTMAVSDKEIINGSFIIKIDEFLKAIVK